MISRRGIVTAATLIMLGNIASRLLGLVREQVVAAVFGNTASTSTFVAASTVPTMVYDLLIGGALTAALIPVFTDFDKDQDRKSLWALASTVMLLATGALMAMTVILVIFAQPLMSFLAAGLSPEDQEQGLVLVRVAMPSVLFLGLSGITTALLYSRQVFVFPAFCVAGFNIGIIVAATTLSGVLDTTSLVIGILIGALLQLVLQLPGLRKIGFRFVIDLHHPGLRRIAQLYAPVALGVIIAQVGVLIDRNLASQTGPDSLAVMRWATTLVQLPVGVIGMAISYAVLPTLSRHASDAQQKIKDAERMFKGTLVTGIRLALLLMIPATIGLVVLRVPIVQLLFEHGLFDAYGTERTALAFLCYAPQLPFLPLDTLLIFAFYARKNTKVPVIVGIVTVGAYLVTALSLMGPLGMPGLAIANAVQNTLHAVVLFVLLSKAIGSLRGFGLWTTVGKAILASGLMGIVLYLLLPTMSGWADQGTTLGQLLVVVAGILLGGIVYLLVTALLRVEELSALKRVVARRLPHPQRG